MYNFDKLIPLTDAEIAETQKLQRLRQSESLRKERLFNARNRLMGMDVEAIEKQIEEKKLRKKMESEENDAFTRKLIHQTEQANCNQELIDHKRKQIAKDIDVYRLTVQKKESTREFDLNDPNALKKQMPMRLPDVPDPREQTMGSFLKFNSEDYDGEKERKLKKHLWQCLAKQITEDRINKKKSEIFNLQSGNDIMNQDILLNKIIKREETIRTEAEKSIMEYNLMKAEYDRNRKKLEQQKEAEDGVAHIKTCMESDFFTENRSTMKSSLGLDRHLRYHYKGMTDEELIQIKHEQLKQIEEAKERKNIEKQTDKYWTEVGSYQLGLKTVKQGLIDKEKEQQLRNLLEENRRLAAEQAVQREHMKKVANDNFPSNEYFDYFNTTSR